jgi:preprotein translocase subunit SecA
MKPDPRYFVQRDLNFAIVDEVDSILIDEARTPLIISGPSEENTQLYGVANRVIPQLKSGPKGEAAKGIEETGDYWIDEKAGSATLTEQGVGKVEGLLKVDNLYDPRMLPLLHAVNQALVAHALKKRDVDYLVEMGERGKPEVVIIDEFTGRKMTGRRWSDGLHQAVEAKEGIPIQSENQTLASITFQNFFRMYDKLSGMTGTADTEAPEFASTYGLDVVLIPTHRPMIRRDLPDVVYKTKKEKFDAVVEDIKECYERGQPVLVGTISIETSEKFSRQLTKRGIPHDVLNAKHHEREAEIVAQAGRFGAVTISTNMAGRGTDIVLGGNPEMLALAKCKGDREHEDFPGLVADFEESCVEERDQVVEAGGLHIIGTERHESRRIDNQLRGRSGRQGDPGSSRFYLSLEDDLLRIFEADRVKDWWDRVGVEEGEAIEHRLLTRVIENAQKKVEARNFDIRKHLLEYDDVMNKQRTALYGRRRDLLTRDDEGLAEEIQEMIEGVIVSLLDQHWPPKGDPDEGEIAELARAFEGVFGVAMDPAQPPFREGARPTADRDALGHALLERLLAHREEKARHWDELAERYPGMLPPFARFERELLIRRVDRSWKEHLHTMDGLREGVSLRGYGQRDPKLEYQREGFALFEEMNASIDQLAVEEIFKVQIQESALEEAAAARSQPTGPIQSPAPAAAGQARRPAPPGPGGAPAAGPLAPPHGAAPAKPRKVGRNDPCPCGSGKKYKKCCGAA